MIKRFVLGLYVHFKVWRDTASMQRFATVTWRLEISSLSLRGCNIEDSHLLKLATIFPNLRKINLSDTRVTDNGLVHLLSFASLKALIIDDTRSLEGLWDSGAYGCPPHRYGGWVWIESREPNFRRDWLQNHLPDCTVWLRGNERQSCKYPS